jgi:hypothetical protein
MCGSEPDRNCYRIAYWFCTNNINDQNQLNTTNEEVLLVINITTNNGGTNATNQYQHQTRTNQIDPIQ